MEEDILEKFTQMHVEPAAKPRPVLFRAQTFSSTVLVPMGPNEEPLHLLIYSSQVISSVAPRERAHSFFSKPVLVQNEKSEWVPLDAQPKDEGISHKKARMIQ